MSDEQSSGGPPRPKRAVGIVRTSLVALAAIVAVGAGAYLARTGATGPASPAGQQITLGASVQGAPITMLRFGGGPRRVLVLAGVHGDEFGSPVAEAFTAALQADPALVPAGTTIDVLASLNPDGRTAGTKGNARATDINRNMPTADWSAKLDKRDLSAKRGLNGGTSAGSEPETQALLRALGTPYDVVISLHSAGGLVDYDGPGAEALAGIISKASGLPLGHVAYQSYTHGSLGGYLTQLGTPLVTVELESATLQVGLQEGILALAQTP